MPIWIKLYIAKLKKFQFNIEISCSFYILFTLVLRVEVICLLDQDESYTRY